MITLAIIIAVLAFAGCAGEEPSASATPAPHSFGCGEQRQVNQISKTPLRKVKHIGIMYGIPKMKMTPSKM